MEIHSRGDGRQTNESSRFVDFLRSTRSFESVGRTEVTAFARATSSVNRGEIVTMKAFLISLAITCIAAISVAAQTADSGQRFDAPPPVLPNADGFYTIAVPGVTKYV